METNLYETVIKLYQGFKEAMQGNKLADAVHFLNQA
jgi:hypothetical protein